MLARTVADGLRVHPSACHWNVQMRTQSRGGCENLDFLPLSKMWHMRRIAHTMLELKSFPQNWEFSNQNKDPSGRSKRTRRNKSSLTPTSARVYDAIRVSKRYSYPCSLIQRRNGKCVYDPKDCYPNAPYLPNISSAAPEQQHQSIAAS